MDEITGMDRRDFLRMVALQGLASSPLRILEGKPEKDVTMLRGETIEKTPLQKLASRTEPPKYDQKRVIRFFRKYHPRSEGIIPLVWSACKKYRHVYPLDPLLVMAQIKQESDFKEYDISPVGAGGLMQFMPSTAKEMGMENVHYPAHYKKTREKHAGARKLFRKLERYKESLFSEAGDDLRALLTKQGKRATELGKNEMNEIRRRLYLHWTGLEGLEPEIRELYEGRLEEMISRIRKPDNIWEIFAATEENMEYLAGELSGLFEEYKRFAGKARQGTRVLNHLLEYVLRKERYDELLEEVMRGYERYIEELKAGIFVNYEPGRKRFKKLVPRPADELEKFDMRFVKEINIDNGVKYLAVLAREFDNLVYALCAFNCGRGNVYRTVRNPRTGRRVRTPRIPFIRETVNYFDKIFRNYNSWYRVLT